MAIAATGSRIKRALPKIDFQGTRAILISIAVLSLLILTVSAVAAHAHAALAHASPSAGSTMRAAPHEVVLTFTERLEGAFSNLTVTDASGTEVSQGKALKSTTIPCV
jgi:methionine-rich copper-binding protein CopC